MIVRDVTSDYPLFLPESKTPRSPGIHVSSIIRCIATEMGILKPEWAEELSLADVRKITDPVAILRISIGLAVEQYYIPEILSHYGVADHPGELFYDGVYMTHDGEDVGVIVTLSRPALRVHEIKATYKSTKTVADLNTQWMWLAQMKAYCIALGTRFAVLHVFFLCGDYKFPIKPTRQVMEIEFTQEELDNNWKDLSDYKAYRLNLEAQERDNMELFGE
jgi:hypothetical protein